MNTIYKDDRGEIEMLAQDCKIEQTGSISLIRSFAGKTRANHWHKEDDHTILILKGEMEIYEQMIGLETYKPIKTYLKQGDLHFTPSRCLHTMYFLTDCDFLCLSKLRRDQAHYEVETVRFDYSLRDLYLNWAD